MNKKQLEHYKNNPQAEELYDAICGGHIGFDGTEEVRKMIRRFGMECYEHGLRNRDE